MPKKPVKRAPKAAKAVKVAKVAKVAKAPRGRAPKAIIAAPEAVGRKRGTGRPPGRPPKRLKLPPGRVVTQLKALLKINGRLSKRIEKLVELLAD